VFKIEILVPFLLPAFRRVCLPFIPATDKQIQNVLKLLGTYGKENHALAEVGPKIIDLGSGDGRIVSHFLLQTKFAAQKAKVPTN
jgi:hypothetical protein